MLTMSNEIMLLRRMIIIVIVVIIIIRIISTVLPLFFAFKGKKFVEQFKQFQKVCSQ